MDYYSERNIIKLSYKIYLNKVFQIQNKLSFFKSNAIKKKKKLQRENTLAHLWKKHNISHSPDCHIALIL